MPHRKNQNNRFSLRKKAKSTTVTIPRNRITYKLPGDQFHVALKWSGTYNFTVNAFSNQIFPVATPGINLPKYWAEFFGIYKYCYLEAVNFSFQVTETNSRPLRVVLAESNTQDVTPTNFLELSETPRAVQKIIIAGGNQSVVHLNKKTSAKAIMGHNLENDEAWWNTVAAGPTAPITPIMVLAYEPIVPLSVCSVSILVSVVYHLKYFTLNHL